MSTTPDAKPPQAVRQDTRRVMPGQEEGGITCSNRSEPDRLALSIEETSSLLGISRSLGYELAAQGRIPTVRLGRRVVVPRAALERLLAGDYEPTS
jgi:excisionase family DNA binding protein